MTNEDEVSELIQHNVSMIRRIARLQAELAKPEDARLREVIEALDGRAVMFDNVAMRVSFLLRELDSWIVRAGEAERDRDRCERAIREFEQHYRFGHPSWKAQPFIAELFDIANVERK